MVISGRLKRVAFYCRMNPRNKDYTQFLESIAEMLNEHFGKDKWEMKMYFEIASGVAPDRAEFLKLQAEIKAGAWDVVITRRATMIARDWRQFMEFMEVCDRCRVEVLCLDENEDAAKQYQCIQEFSHNYFGGGSSGTS